MFYTDKDDSTNIHKTNWQATNLAMWLPDMIAAKQGDYQ